MNIQKPCPFCGGVFRAYSEGDSQAIMHSQPPCKKFLDEDALMFLHNVRMATVGPLPDDDEWPMPIKQDPS